MDDFFDTIGTMRNIRERIITHNRANRLIKTMRAFLESMIERKMQPTTPANLNINLSGPHVGHTGDETKNEPYETVKHNLHDLSVPSEYWTMLRGDITSFFNVDSSIPRPY